eukprot:CCRYP_001898-RA/>CCRYP_001898-RA protein AED:0.31 eAED:0.31 QI:0/-1/0/1/-1/0/1/0/441
MKACGIHPTRQVLDNKLSVTYKLAITNSGMAYQLVPPDDHRRNIAEKAIQTWKDHFIAVISGTDTKFPLHHWCQLLPQMERQLSLLRQSNSHPHISSHTHLYSHHDYNAQPFVPLGMEALVHDKPHRRKTFAQHFTKGYVIGTSYKHYRCWKVWTPSPCTTRLSVTVFFKHKYVTNPSVTPADAIIAATTNLSHLLTNKLTSHHNNNLQLTDLTQLHILSQPPPLPPQREQHTPNTRTTPSSPQPSTLPVVSDYNSDSSASDDESVSTQLLWPQSPPTSTRVTPLQTIPPHPRVSTPPTAPAYNTRSHVQTITQETILHLLHNTRTPLTPLQAATRRFFPRCTLSHHRHRHRGTPRVLVPHEKPKVPHHVAYGKELGHLAQGIPGTVQGTIAIVFIAPGQIPANCQKDITNGQICANFRPEKDDSYHNCLTVGGKQNHIPW